MEQLVGDISDEHEPLGPTMFKRVDDNTADVDAAIEIEDLNRLSGLDIPEDDDFDTLAGMITRHLERIPAAGATLDLFGGLFTVLEATPARVVRVRVFVKPKTA
jgi:CBS domain containing-hemolysin-like protein